MSTIPWRILSVLRTRGAMAKAIAYAQQRIKMHNVVMRISLPKKAPDAKNAKAQSAPKPAAAAGKSPTRSGRSGGDKTGDKTAAAEQRRPPPPPKLDPNQPLTVASFFRRREGGASEGSTGAEGSAGSAKDKPATAPKRPSAVTGMEPRESRGRRGFRGRGRVIPAQEGDASLVRPRDDADPDAPSFDWMDEL